MELGKYEIIAELGRGGFGIVYKAHDTVLNVDRALKVLHPGLVADETFLARFKQEAQFAAQLEHSNLVPVYDFGEADGRFYLAMKYISGGSLKDLLARGGKLDQQQAFSIFQQMAKGISFAHSKGIVHRDLKPGNILFDQDGSVRVSDLGFAKAMVGSSSMSLSASGAMVGSPAYMAPEIWRGKPATPATDIYSLGCILYEMLTGKVLFDGVSPADMVTKHVVDGPRFDDGLPEQLFAVLKKALAMDPDNRYKDLDEFGEALKEGTRQVIHLPSGIEIHQLPPANDTGDGGSSNIKEENQETEEEQKKDEKRSTEEKTSHQIKPSYFNSNNSSKLPWGLFGFLALVIVIMVIKPWKPQDISESVPTSTDRSTATATLTPIGGAQEQTETENITLSIQATTENPVSEEEIEVGIVLPSEDEPRWIQDETRFRAALETAGYDVEILFSQGSSSMEKDNVEALLTKGIKVLIICPQDGTAAAAAADAAAQAGVKVISYDRLILDTNSVDYYVTFDSIAVGAAQAQYLVDKVDGTGLPLYLYAGAASDNNAFLFFEGAWNVLQPKIADGTFVIKNSSQAVALSDKATLTRDEMAQIIGQITTNWDFNTAKGLAEANLTATTAADKGKVFILAPNDGTARAIADTFGTDSDVTQFYVTGQDAEIASVQYIIDGKQSMTVLKDVRTLVSDAINAAVAFLEGKTPVQTHTYDNGVKEVPAKPSEVVSVDAANVKAALIDSGYYPADQFTGLK